MELFYGNNVYWPCWEDGIVYWGLQSYCNIFFMQGCPANIQISQANEMEVNTENLQSQKCSPSQKRHMKTEERCQKQQAQPASQNTDHNDEKISNNPYSMDDEQMENKYKNNILQRVKAKLEIIHQKRSNNKCMEWLPQDDQFLMKMVCQQNCSWSEVLEQFPRRTYAMVYCRFRRLQKRANSDWGPKEKQKLVKLVSIYGRNWAVIREHFPKFSLKQLRQRYNNSLNPMHSRKPFTLQEDLRIVEHVMMHGTTWKMLGDKMSNRSEGWLKCRYYNQLQKLLISENIQVKTKKRSH